MRGGRPKTTTGKWRRRRRRRRKRRRRRRRRKLYSKLTQRVRMNEYVVGWICGL